MSPGPRGGRTPRRLPVPAPLAVLAPALALVLTACGGGDGTQPPRRGDRHVVALAHERRDARDALLDVLAAADGPWIVTSVDTAGRWSGCESTWPDGFRSYRYETDAAVHVARPPTVAALRAALVGAGASDVREQEIVGAVRVTGRSGRRDLALTTTGHHVVAVRVDGGCVDVPPQERNTWLTRPDHDQDYGSR